MIQKKKIPVNDYCYILCFGNNTKAAVMCMLHFIAVAFYGWANFNYVIYCWVV